MEKRWGTKQSDSDFPELLIMPRTAKLYLIVTTIALFGMFGLLHLGSRLPAPVGPPTATTAGLRTQSAAERPGGEHFLTAATSNLFQNGANGLSRLFLQLLITVIAAALVGNLFTRFGQPAVVGEMIVGILLGPSFLGWIAPDVFGFLFAPFTLEPLRLFSQIGVCLFLFVVGMELDVVQLRRQVQTAILVSHSSIVIPYLLGVALALFLYSSLANPGVSFTSFGLFMGISMSITAFPVLVRILKDRKMFHTSLGTMATGCAAVDDVTAWTILAFVVAIARATTISSAVLALGLVILFVSCMLMVARPVLGRLLGPDALEREQSDKTTITIVLAVVLASAFTTELIGIHALFGAFLAGIAMPRTSEFQEKVTIRVENLTTVLLLPVFFVFTGLRTRIGLLSTPHDWAVCGIVIAVATLGKLGGSALAARLTGMDGRTSLQLGALMNTRGLMELIALNIGYDLGILSQRIFAMLVIMALVTTFFTGPLLALFRERKREDLRQAEQRLLS
jgi:Kef-type K+ transport system membrane component KefB